jgi:hypothetical protein
MIVKSQLYFRGSDDRPIAMLMARTILLSICTWWVSYWRSEGALIMMVERLVTLTCPRLFSALERVLVEGERFEIEMN